MSLIHTNKFSAIDEDDTEINNYREEEQNNISPTFHKNNLPLDIVIEWINSEENDLLYGAKRMFLNKSMKNLKHNNYSLVYRAFDILQYLPYVSQRFFRIIVDHFDFRNSNIGRLWEWKFFKDKIFVVAVDKIESEFDRWEEDSKIRNQEIIKNDIDFEGNLSSKAYSTLRRHGIRDFCDKFMSLAFFTTFEEAKSYIFKRLKGKITFIKSERNKIQEDGMEIGNY